MLGEIFKRGVSALRLRVPRSLKRTVRHALALACACLLGIPPWTVLAQSSESGWLYVLDPRFELRVWGISEVKDYEIQVYGRSPGVADERWDIFCGKVRLNAEKQWVDGGKLVLQGKLGDLTLQMKFTAQGGDNWSARKRNYYPGKDWDALKLVPTGVLPGITGRYENTYGPVRTATSTSRCRRLGTACCSTLSL